MMSIQFQFVLKSAENDTELLTGCRFFYAYKEVKMKSGSSLLLGQMSTWE